MAISLRSYQLTGIAMVIAAAVALVPSGAAARAPHEGHPPIAPTASVQPAVGTAALPNLLVGWLERIVVPPSAGQPVPVPQPVAAVGGTSIDSTIKNVYNTFEPWVRYGFELATYAVGWIPGVGWLSPQIMIFYNFGERIARSITFNVADWLGGNVSFVQGLANVGRDTVHSFIQLGADELHFFLPPLPPLPFAATGAATQVSAGVRSAVKVGRGGGGGIVATVGSAEQTAKTATTKPPKKSKPGVTVRPSSGHGTTTAVRAARRPG
jgi:hypothetical protein